MASRFQFSLRTLLMLTVTIGAVSGFVLVCVQNQTLRGRVSALIGELGYVEIGDPEKGWARAAPTEDPYRWRIRIYLPKAGKFRFGLQTEEIVPNVMNRHEARYTWFETKGRTEFRIDVQVQVDPSGSGNLILRRVMPTGASSERNSSISWKKEGFSPQVFNYTDDFPHLKRSVSFDAAKPMTLLSLKTYKITGPSKSSNTNEPGPGLHLWIEPEP